MTGVGWRAGSGGETVRLGLRENRTQFWLLVVVNAFVGSMVGLERSVLPLLAESEFGIASASASLSFVATFGLGIAGYGGYSAPPTPPRTTAAAGQGPEWFTRMDRNGDGDLSLKEFLGTGSDFKNLDANGDGFLEAKEATAEK